MLKLLIVVNDGLFICGKNHFFVFSRYLDFCVLVKFIVNPRQKLKEIRSHCIKSVCIWSFSGLYWIRSGSDRIQTRKTPNSNTFHAVSDISAYYSKRSRSIFNFISETEN